MRCRHAFPLVRPPFGFHKYLATEGDVCKLCKFFYRVKDIFVQEGLPTGADENKALVPDTGAIAVALVGRVTKVIEQRKMYQ